MQIRENVALAPLTYYKIGGPARYFCQPESIEDLRQAAEFLREKNCGYFILGAGSNVLLDDAGIEGLVIQTSKLDRTLECKDGVLTAGAGVMVIQLLRLCMSQGISGMEFLCGVPGNLGGVLFMNAGTSLGEVTNRILTVSAFDLDTGVAREIPKAELRYSYRKNHFLKPNEVLLRGSFAVDSTEPEKVQKTVQALLEARRKSQPVDKPSCGSVFKNPDPAKGVHAWKVISEAGLRGLRIGGAQISELHTNYIINTGGAKAEDVKALIAEAKAKVFERSGVRLEEEVRIIGKQPTSRLAAAATQKPRK